MNDTTHRYCLRCVQKQQISPTLPGGGGKIMAGSASLAVPHSHYPCTPVAAPLVAQPAWWSAALASLHSSSSTGEDRLGAF